MYPYPQELLRFLRTVNNSMELSFNHKAFRIPKRLFIRPDWGAVYSQPRSVPVLVPDPTRKMVVGYILEEDIVSKGVMMNRETLEEIVTRRLSMSKVGRVTLPDEIIATLEIDEKDTLKMQGHGPYFTLKKKDEERNENIYKPDSISVSYGRHQDRA